MTFRVRSPFGYSTVCFAVFLVRRYNVATDTFFADDGETPLASGSENVHPIF